MTAEVGGQASASRLFEPSSLSAAPPLPGSVPGRRAGRDGRRICRGSRPVSFRPDCRPGEHPPPPGPGRRPRGMGSGGRPGACGESPVSRPDGRTTLRSPHAPAHWCSAVGRPTRRPWKRFRPPSHRAHGQAHGHTPGCTFQVHAAPSYGTGMNPAIPAAPLNGRDPANYCGSQYFSAPWRWRRSPGSRPAERSARPGRSACAEERPSLCQGCAHVQGFTRAER